MTKLLFALGALTVILMLFGGSTAEDATEQPQVVEEMVVARNSTGVEGSSSATCSCDNSEDPVCASNGVTYKNSCRFDCTKKRVKRLRVVKRGKCAGMTRNQYHNTRPTNRPTSNAQSFDSIFNSFFSRT